MDLESVLVTGANRGIGLELVRQLVHSAAPPRFIFATHRTADCQQELEEIAKGAPDGVKLILVQMDVTSSLYISAAQYRISA
ncbi:hypothetical protein JTE90_013496 [Oedothorax gibbosus]|uniref:Uncharacterized protein n=1 Tax=Oedothorax gibbosus TaxID=931172 RepID=A0AAV6VNR5_9ARAC|nr:hypothetical protein JTE90_013496 [Oedothorax gibbosus]